MSATGLLLLICDSKVRRRVLNYRTWVNDWAMCVDVCFRVLRNVFHANCHSRAVIFRWSVESSSSHFAHYANHVNLWNRRRRNITAKRLRAVGVVRWCDEPLTEQWQADIMSLRHARSFSFLIIKNCLPLDGHNRASTFSQTAQTANS